jgi:hypothetical protein
VEAIQHDIGDQIKADQYAATVAAVSNPFGGIRVCRMIQPGTVYSHGFPHGHREV